MALLERVDDLAALAAALEAAAAGSGRVVLVSGEAGLGKSSLVAEFARRVASRSRVLRGACDPLLTPRPLGPLHDVARQGAPRLASALSATAEGRRETIFAATIEELQRGRSPVLLVVEDAHWADEATLDLLRFLGRRVATVPALVVVTYRDDETGARHPLRRLIGELPTETTRRVRLAPLSADAVRHLAQVAGRSDAGLHTLTGGNPFFVTEALAAAETEGEIPVTIRDAVLARAARLSPPARAVMELVSVVPMRAEPWLIAEVLAPEAATLEECTAIGMVMHRDGALAFRHELARRAVEDALTPERRRVLHARCLALLQANQARADHVAAARLVHHAVGAGDAEAVLLWAPRAAEQAAVAGAHREAARHFVRALEVAAGLPPEQRAALWERRSYECYLTDQVGEARAARYEALTIWRAMGDQVRVGDTLRWLSRLAWFVGERAAADQHARDAVEVLEPLPPGRALAMAYSNAAQLRMLVDDVEGAAAWGERAIALAERLGHVEALAHALNNVGSAQMHAEVDGGQAYVERSLSLSLANDWSEHAARAFTNLGSAAVVVRRFDEARRWLDAGIAYSVERDLDSWALYMRAWRARLRFETGDWTGAADDASAVVANPLASAVSRIPALAALARIRRHREDPGWRELLEEARTLATSAAEAQRVVPVCCAWAEASWLDGDAADAGGAAAWGWPFVLSSPVAWRRAEVATWLWRTERFDGTTSALPAVTALQLAGDWCAAAAAWEAIGAVVEQAYALADAPAEGALRAALDLFERLGSKAGATMVRRRLHAIGARGVPRGARPRTRAHPAGLTERQNEILSLLCRGLRNTEIAERVGVSEKTVDHHVSAVLQKLGARSRTEAAARARSLGLG